MVLAAITTRAMDLSDSMAAPPNSTAHLRVLSPLSALAHRISCAAPQHKPSPHPMSPPPHRVYVRACAVVCMPITRLMHCIARGAIPLYTIAVHTVSHSTTGGMAASPTHTAMHAMHTLTPHRPLQCASHTSPTCVCHHHTPCSSSSLPPCLRATLMRHPDHHRTINSVHCMC